MAGSQAMAGLRDSTSRQQATVDSKVTRLERIRGSMAGRHSKRGLARLTSSPKERWQDDDEGSEVEKRKQTGVSRLEEGERRGEAEVGAASTPTSRR
jgi:hypothetical protein